MLSVASVCMTFHVLSDFFQLVRQFSVTIFFNWLVFIKLSSHNSCSRRINSDQVFTFICCTCLTFCPNYIPSLLSDCGSRFVVSNSLVISCWTWFCPHHWPVVTKKKRSALESSSFLNVFRASNEKPHKRLNISLEHLWDF